MPPKPSGVFPASFRVMASLCNSPSPSAGPQSWRGRVRSLPSGGRVGVLQRAAPPLHFPQPLLSPPSIRPSVTKLAFSVPYGLGMCRPVRGNSSFRLSTWFAPSPSGLPLSPSSASIETAPPAPCLGFTCRNQHHWEDHGFCSFI